MNTYRKNARIVGILFIIATAAGVLSFSFLGAVGGPDYLTAMAENENDILIGAMLVLLLAFTCAGIAIWLYPVLRQHNEALALGAAGFRVIEAVFHTASVVALLSLLSLSRVYVEAGMPDAARFETVGTLLLESRDWAINVVGTFAWLVGALMYYVVFFRSKLIPRWLSIWGIAGVPLSLIATILLLFHVLDSMSTIHTALHMPIAAQ
jgi:hypothetical protein